MNLKCDKTSKDMAVKALSWCKKGLHTTQVLQNIQSGSIKWQDTDRATEVTAHTLKQHKVTERERDRQTGRER